MASVALFSFLVRLFDAIPGEGVDIFAAVGGSGAFTLVLVGALFLALAYFCHSKLDVSFIYRLSLPIMALGLSVVALFFESHHTLSVIIICVGYELFDILSWVLFADIARGGKRPRFFVFGVGVGATFLGMGAGYAVGGIFIAPGVESGAMDMTSVALISIVILMVTAFLVLPESTLHLLTARKLKASESERDARKADSAPDAASPAHGETLEMRCASIAAAYGLTPREGEVLVFLARGRTLPIVARDLYITKNTARSHIEKVYQKTGIHRQQDLIDLMEAWPNRPKVEK